MELTRQEIQEQIIQMELLDEAYDFLTTLPLSEEEKWDFIDWWQQENEFRAFLKESD